MQYKPHEYQQYATKFILEHPVAAILLDMGLGKSVITLTAIKQLIHQDKVHRVLVVAPLRVAKQTWPEEINKWDHLKDLTYSVITGNKSQRVKAAQKEVDIYIINRENLKWLIESSIPFDYDMLVIDELSSFKSYRSQRFKALKRVRPLIKRIVGLTGTPSSNGLMDLWAEFRVLDMGKRLGRFISYYRANYFDPDKRNMYQVFTYKPKPGAEQSIYRAIDDITISMKSKDYLQLPPLTMNTVPVKMSPSEQTIYDELNAQLVVSTQGKQIDALNAASLSNKLCQMANACACYNQQQVVRMHQRRRSRRFG